MNDMKLKILFILIFLLAFIIRVYHLDLVPTGLNRDEAALGYTAYSILKTGRDEYGKVLPLSLESFGDWKLPLYSYVSIPAVLFLSLSETSVRIVSSFVGTLSSGLVFFLILFAFADFVKKRRLALLSMILFAVSPWSVHFSRVASEANLAVFLTLFALVIFFWRKNSKLRLIVSGLILSFTLLTYHGNHIFSPLLFLGLCRFLFLNQKSWAKLLSFVVPFLFVAAVIFSQTLFSANKTKLSGLTPLSDPYLLYSRVTQMQSDYPVPGSIESKLFDNKVGFLIGRFLDGYIKSFSPEFLFISGGTNLQHNIPYIGNMYIIESVFLLFGLFALFHKKYNSRFIFVYWLLISPLGAAITKDAPHSARMLSILPVPQIITALGIIFFIGVFSQKKFFHLIILVISVLFTLNISLYFSRYFIHFPKVREDVWGGGYKELVSRVLPILSNYPEVIMDKPGNSPYIYFLFYGKMNPSYVQTDMLHYDADAEGFHHVKEIGNLKFENFDGTHELLVPNRLLILRVDSTVPSSTHSAILHTPKTISEVRQKYGTDYGLKVGDLVVSHILDTIYLKNGEKQFYLIETKKYGN
jgi:hypothetical protein